MKTTRKREKENDWTVSLVRLHRVATPSAERVVEGKKGRTYLYVDLRPAFNNGPECGPTFVANDNRKERERERERDAKSTK